MNKPRMFRAKVAEKYFVNESKKMVLVKLELVEPSRIQFRAGQYISIKIDKSGERRSYSIASTPDVTHGVELVVDISPGGKGSQFINNLSLGEEVEFLGPLGRFVVKTDSSEEDKDELKGERKFLFVATGSGIAPIRSMILDLLINKKETRPIRLHWGLRYEEDVFWLDEWEKLMEENRNFVLDLVLSRPREGWGLCWGHVQDCLRRDVIPKTNLEDWEAYLCGNQRMIEEVEKLLVEGGMVKERIYREQFE